MRGSAVDDRNQQNPQQDAITQIDGELAVLQHAIDVLEVLDEKVRERVVVYLYDRYSSRSPWP